MVIQNERGKNTHGKGDQVKIPLLPNNVDKKSVNAGPTIGSRHLAYSNPIFGISMYRDLVPLT